VVRLKRDVAVKDSVQADASGPNVDWKSLVADLANDLRCNVGGSPTLFEQKFV
jgi:hypothetical protein